MTSTEKGARAAPFLRFAETAERLLDNGYSPLPVAPGEKAVKLRNWQQHCRRPPSAATLSKWIARFPDHGTGGATGFLVGIDADYLDQRTAEHAAQVALATLGDTPLVRIGRAPKWMRFYRTPEPFTTMKADGAEVLSLGRQAVLFHIHPDTGRPYAWIDETPLDVPLDQLPVVSEDQCRRWFLTVTGRDAAASSLGSALVLAEKGARHDTFFPLVRREGMNAGSFDDLLSEARRINAAVCVPPLPDSQVLAMVRGVWRYREQGTLWNDDGEARALVRASEFIALADEPDALALLILLRLSHGARREPFALASEAMAERRLIGDFGEKRYARLRDVLTELGFLELVHRGVGRGNPHLYRLSYWTGKGAQTADNIKEIPPPSLIGMERVRTVVQVRYDLDGSTTVTTATEMTRLLFDAAALPIQPTPAEVLRQTARAAFRAAGRGAQSRAAEAIGVTRGQLASYLSGRYGLNPPAEAALRQIVGTGGAS